MPELLTDDDGDPVQPASMETLHPNQDGNLAYVRTLNGYMDMYGYRW
ncbi:hypothetical protein OG559_07865 [Micromonospora sp. NBC_01405]